MNLSNPNLSHMCMWINGQTGCSTFHRGRPTVFGTGWLHHQRHVVRCMQISSFYYENLRISYIWHENLRIDKNLRISYIRLKNSRMQENLRISYICLENLIIKKIWGFQAHITLRSVSYRGASHILSQRSETLEVAMAMAASCALLVQPCSPSSSTTPPLPARIALFTNLTTPPQLRLDKRAGSAIRAWQARKSTPLVLAAAAKTEGGPATAAALAVDSDAPASVLVEKLLSLVTLVCNFCCIFVSCVFGVCIFRIQWNTSIQWPCHCLT